MKQLPDCLSDLVLDKIVAENATPEQYRQHLSECSACQSRLAEFTTASSHTDPMVQDLVARARQRAAEDPPKRRLSDLFTIRRFAYAAVGAVACAALLMTITYRDPQSPTAADSAIRIKGNNLRFFVQRHGRVAPGKSGEAYRSGDALRFVVSNPKPVFFMLVGAEESGKVNVYHPYDGAESVRLEPGIDRALPGSLILDDSAEPEYFVGLFTQAPVSISEVTRAIDQAIKTDQPMEVSLRSLTLGGQHHLVVVRRE